MTSKIKLFALAQEVLNKFDVPYVTVGNSSELSQERAITAGAGVLITDNGANSSIIISTTGSVGGMAGAGANNYVAIFTGTSVIEGKDDFQWDGTTLTIGNATPGRDYILKFDGETNDGIITFKEDEKQFSLDGGLIVNEAGADVDTRFEAVGEANALFIRGSEGFIGHGIGTPIVPLHIVMGSGSDGSIEGNEIAIFRRNATVGSDAYIVVTSGNEGTAGLLLGDVDDINNCRIRYDNLSKNLIFSYGSTTRITLGMLSGNIGIGLTPTANMAGLSIEAGLLTLKERALPTADTNYGKIWTESDNTLHFQDGAGTEYTIDITPV